MECQCDALGLVVFIKMTEPIMIAVASQMRGSSGSAANQFPSNTATIGLTYAYVATSEMGAFCNNQPKEANPISEPTKIRYNNPYIERIETLAGSQLFNSPVMSEMTNRPMLPINICAPVVINDDLGRSADLL